ncbi:MAG: hypothetical protein IT239_03250 [Bacteroidia bacterium]|nr:hypothetical protein [Bacteroidia bacterium]
MKKLFYTITFLLLIVAGKAQNITVRAFSDTSAIRIGEQFKITFSAQGAIGSRFVFPDFMDTITGHIEVIKKLKPDTVLSESKEKITINQTYIATSFDSGYWAIPPVKIYNLPDTSKFYETEPFLITVNTVLVDTTQAIKNIKQPYSAPISWQEWVPKALIILAILVAIFIGWKIYKKRKNKPTPQIIEPIKSPAKIALERLEELSSKKLWQATLYKEYFSEITDIIKSYLDAKYIINTQEQITNDTLKTMQGYLTQEDLYRLKRVLQLADMVKFAKEIPLANQCESSFTDTKEIILSTSVIIQKENNV